MDRQHNGADGVGPGPGNSDQMDDRQLLVN
jgi:hypothetical protein